LDHNVVIRGSAWVEGDIPVIFGEEEVIFSEARDLPNLLVNLGIYPSTSAARRAGRVGPIPLGYTELKASKRDFLFIWNPHEDWRGGMGVFQFPEWDKSGRDVEKQVATHMELVDQFVTEWDTCIQAGGNCGVYPWHLAQRFKRVVTFEPSLENLGFLEKNCADVADKLEIHWGGVYGETKFRPIRLYAPRNCGSFYMGEESEIETLGKSLKGVVVHEKVPCWKIDDWGFQKVGLIYLDIQGDEYDALVGAKETIDRYSPVLAIEYCPKKASCKYSGDVDELLGSWGYTKERKHRLDSFYVRK